MPNSDSFVQIRWIFGQFLRFSIFGRWQENEILWGVGGIPARNFIKMKFSRVLVQVLQEWAIPGAGGAAGQAG